jgi:acetyl-CoA carboxylase, biotin carboxyl carrier protein
MDTQKIKKIIALFEESKLAKMELEVEDIKIKMEKPAQEINYVSNPAMVMLPSATNSSKAESVESKNVDSGEAITSPLVGIYYEASGTGEKPFVEVGSTVKKGDTLCIIEAMKVMNEIKASKSGVVKSIKAKNGEAVQFNDVLMHIE